MLNHWLAWDEFEQYVLNWYQQDRLSIYGDTGKMGDVFLYNFHGGKRHYYQLKTE